jgi:hypothetical protein
MDRSHLGSPVPNREALAGECRSCALAQELAARGARGEPPYVAEDIDDDVLVISETDLDGLVVLPREHVGGLEELSVPRRAHVLAALRRATQSVRNQHPGSAGQVVVMTGPPASDGHVCFQVVPNDSQHHRSSPSYSP